jgi:hypothetical protein
VLTGSVWAQISPASQVSSESSNLLASDVPPSSAPVEGVPANPPSAYIPPSEAQKFHNFAWNAVGPVAFAGSSVAAAIDQGFNFPGKWGQGAGAYGARVASNLGISLVTASAQYSLAEAFHEDTAYYRCTCAGFFPRLLHAAVSSVASRRGDDGHTALSPALTISPFIGPLTAANTWIPDRNGAKLGFNMGLHNLLGQFGQDEALEFLYGGPHTILGRLQHRFSKHSN